MAYKQTTKFTCGPSAYIETEKSKTKSRVLEYHEKRRIKPSKAFFGVSFLEINPKLNLYTQRADSYIDKKFINMVYTFEHLKNQFTMRELKSKMTAYYGLLLKKHKNKIHIIKDQKDILHILNHSIALNKPVLLLTHSSHWLRNGVLHWILFLNR